MSNQDIKEIDEELISYITEKKIQFETACAKIEFLTEQNITLSEYLRQKEESAFQELKNWYHLNTNKSVDNIDEFFVDLGKYITKRRKISSRMSIEYRNSLETILNKNKHCLGLIYSILNHKEIRFRANFFTYLGLTEKRSTRRKLSSRADLLTTITKVRHANGRFYSNIAQVMAELEYCLKQSSDISISKCYIARDAIKNNRTPNVCD